MTSDSSAVSNKLILPQPTAISSATTNQLIIIPMNATNIVSTVNGKSIFTDLLCLCLLGFVCSTRDHRERFRNSLVQIPIYPSPEETHLYLRKCSLLSATHHPSPFDIRWHRLNDIVDGSIQGILFERCSTDHPQRCFEFDLDTITERQWISTSNDFIEDPIRQTSSSKYSQLDSSIDLTAIHILVYKIRLGPSNEFPPLVGSGAPLAAR